MFSWFTNLFSGGSTILYGAIGAIVLGLAGTVAYYHFVTVPILQSHIRSSQAETAIIKAKTVTQQLNILTLEKTIKQENVEVAAVGAKCREELAKANKVVINISNIKLQVPNLASSLAITQWLNNLRTATAFQGGIQ